MDLGAAEASCNELKYRNACVAYEYASSFIGWGERWTEFFKKAFWAGYRLKFHPDDALRLAMLFIYGDWRGPVANQARDHTRALAAAWDKRMSAHDVHKRLQEVGFEGMRSNLECKTPQKESLDASIKKRNFYANEQSVKLLGRSALEDEFDLRVIVTMLNEKPGLYVLNTVKVESSRSFVRGGSRNDSLSCRTRPAGAKSRARLPAISGEGEDKRNFDEE